ncbi:MAG TPA: FprA family A-type flavoprotein [Deltaproteobacteria bacterium]|nr:MAG: flavoprotein [Deltaproteobacteria bacterium GWC2_65_14]HBO70736.1 FprA family A-type flavoprotein [Deltaproteobacteria bacterium]
MATVALAENVHWVGAKDPGLTVFDIVIPTGHGTTYNAYLVRGSEKTALIDCVKRPFAGELFRNIEEHLPVKQLDYVVINHSEPDHAGGLVELLERNPKVTVYLSRSAKTFVDNMVHAGYPFHLVNDGEELPLGGKTLRFLNAPFLHWPDTILTYLVEDRILFPCDFLGAHYASPEYFNDELKKPEEARQAFEFYYSTIMRPYKEHILKAIGKVRALPVDMIAPSHGPILRKDPLSYLDWYEERASVLSRVTGKKVTIVYASAYGNTAAMAEKAAEGVRAAGLSATLMNSIEVPMHKIIDEIEESAGFLIGTPTLNSNVPQPILMLIASLVYLNVRGMRASVFGSYGWSGEAIRTVQEILTSMRIKVEPEPVRVRMSPSEADLAVCVEFGKKFAEIVSGK